MLKHKHEVIAFHPMAPSMAGPAEQSCRYSSTSLFLESPSRSTRCSSRVRAGGGEKSLAIFMFPSVLNVNAGDNRSNADFADTASLLQSGCTK